MSDSDSPDHFFSALELLSTAAVAASADQDNRRAPYYADDSILMCSLPETPCSSSSTTSAVLAAAVSPLARQIIDPLSCSGTRSEREPVNNTKSPVARKLTGEKTGSYSSDDEKQDGVASKECIEVESINPSFAPDTNRDCGDGKNPDDSSECVVDVEKLEFLDLLKLVSKPQKERFVDTDILEIAAMKGIYFPPPRWWSLEGYDAKIKDIEMDRGTKC